MIKKVSVKSIETCSFSKTLWKHVSAHPFWKLHFQNGCTDIWFHECFDNKHVYGMQVWTPSCLMTVHTLQFTVIKIWAHFVTLLHHMVQWLLSLHLCGLGMAGVLKYHLICQGGMLYITLTYERLCILQILWWKGIITNMIVPDPRNYCKRCQNWIDQV